MGTQTEFQNSFLKGTPPKNLDGFYKGKLVLGLPGTAIESIAALITKFWIPWYGKEFNDKHHEGNNSIPSYLFSFVRLMYGEKVIIKRHKDSINVFPFRTKITKGLNDKIEVLQLDYDLPENPENIRSIVDELVCTGGTEYLGKAYLKENKGVRLIAFFSLSK